MESSKELRDSQQYPQIIALLAMNPAQQGLFSAPKKQVLLESLEEEMAYWAKMLT
jgi:hypothetical protein